MNYNLDLFGKKFKQIREKLDLTQNKLAEAAGVDAVTLRRIEKGKVVPQLETLEILSPFLKQDLIALLLEYRFDDYAVFCEIKNKLESELDGEDFHNLHNEYKRLNSLLSSTKNSYYKMLIRQLILLIEAIVLYRDNKNNEALNKLIEAIRITTPSFDLSCYNSFVYSSMEIRILMNMAFVLNKLDCNEKYVEIMEFCITAADSNDEIYPKLCHNLAGVYRRKKDFEKALEFSNMGIKACQDTRILNGLAVLYYGKGIAEYNLNKEEFIESLKISLYLCKSLGQDKLRDTIINNCKKVYGIEL